MAFGSDNAEARRATSLKSVCFVLTSPFAVNAFLKGHLRALADQNSVSLCVNTKESGVAPQVDERVRVLHFDIRRRISPWQDLQALVSLWRLFRRGRIDLVVSLTPKGGLLAMLAARFAGVPHRVHCFTGQVWATRRGPGRWFLKALDQLLVACATRLLADSTSQREYLIEQGVVASGKIEVLARGSMAGVDMQRFRPDDNARTLVRSRYGIGHNAICLLYVGRLKRDKGILDLVEAFSRLRLRFPDLHLLLVGPDEDGLDSQVRAVLQIHRVDYTQVVEEYMAAADIFCLPSYREGFGLVLIEAGAVGLPVVASRIYGITDAVVEGETGVLHQPGDVDDLMRQLEVLIADAGLRKALGEAGRRRTSEMFTAETVTAAMTEFVRQLLHERSRRAG